MKKSKALVLIMAGFLWTMGVVSAGFAAEKHPKPALPFSDTQKHEIEKIVHDYLVSDPKTLVEATRALQVKEEEQAQQTTLKAIEDNKAAIFNDPNVPSYYAGVGKPSATIVEFFDYQCGHCKNMEPIIQKIIKKNKNVKVIFREFPFLGSDSEYAAKAALASAKQGKYYAFHNALFDSQSRLTKVEVLKLAKSAGLNVAQLKKYMKKNSASIDTALKANQELAESLHLMGTPAFVIGVGEMTDSADKNLPAHVYFVPGETSQDNLEKLLAEH